ncbi:glycine zipper domain-containing protein [Insolitispirillum peregrinum]
MMKTLMKVTALTLSASLLLSACQTTTNSNGEPLSPAEQRLRQQADTYNQTIAEGALLGCVLGGVLGAATAQKGNRLQHAAIGCAIGGGIGAGAGAYVADKQEKYANKEQQLDSMIADVREENGRLANVIATTEQVVAEDKQRIEQIDKDLAAGKITMDQAKSKMASVDSNTAYLDSTLTELRKRQANYTEAANTLAGKGKSAQAKELNSEITEMERQISQLQAERDSLAKRRTVSRVG